MRAYLVAILLMLSASSSFAETPEEVVGAYFEKMKTGGFNGIATLMHPDELRKFREMLAPVIEGSLLSEEAQGFEKFAEPNDPKKMQTLNDVEFMNLFMEWVSAAQPNLAAIMKTATIETIGHVTEGEIKHVVVRMKVKAQGLEVEKMSVIGVKDFQGVPKMVLTGEMKGMAEALKRRNK